MTPTERVHDIGATAGPEEIIARTNLADVPAVIFGSKITQISRSDDKLRLQLVYKRVRFVPSSTLVSALSCFWR